MVFVDVGAHVGQYTLVASPIVGPTGGVHAFEPDPDTFSLLARNVAANQLRNVHANREALFSEERKQSLFLSSVADVGSNSLALPARPARESSEVECLTLDGYLRARGVTRVDVMKIDVEGAEYHVLRGATDQLAGNDKPVILIEFEEERQTAFGYSCAKLADLLRSYGYSLVRVGKGALDEYVASEHDERSFNILAIPRNRRDRVLALLQTLSPR